MRLLERDDVEVVRPRDGDGISVDSVDDVKLKGFGAAAAVVVPLVEVLRLGSLSFGDDTVVDGVAVDVDGTAGGPISPADADDALVAAVPAFIDRCTVSPSLRPSYSLSSRSSAMALPLNSQRCLSASGAPFALCCACS